MLEHIQKSLSIGSEVYRYFSLPAFAKSFDIDLNRLPYSIRVLLENLLRNHDGKIVTDEDIFALARWIPVQKEVHEIAYYPVRVLMQDFTGVPCIVDLAALRDAMAALGKDPALVNPQVPVDLVIDHSVQVDYFGSDTALERNLEKEYARNRERYMLLKWSQQAFDNVRVFPPGAGIVHQVNLEYIATVTAMKEQDSHTLLFPDTLVGTDSHTTMINALGVMGWGVGGIEAEAVMLGQPYFLKIPEVIGVRLSGKLREGITTTDLVLTITQQLRKEHVVEKFVEYFGPGLRSLSLPDRATLSNMSPEYGATMGFFPVDEETIRYLQLTNRSREAIRSEAYTRAQGLFYDDDNLIDYTKVIEIDLGSVGASIAGPSRPQDRIDLKSVKERFEEILQCDYGRERSPKALGDFANESSKSLQESEDESCRTHVGALQSEIEFEGEKMPFGDGSIVIAAITSCTNTSNPSVMIGAGLVAKKAVEKGLHVKPFVKTSFAPGSKVVAEYLEQAGLMPFLEALRFHIVGYGCTTCIGNSGPLHPEVENAIKEQGLVASAVLSGNRNFEARIHPDVKTNFLASPMLVIAYAIAGRMDIDLLHAPLGYDPNDTPVYLKDIWPTSEEIDTLIHQTLKPEIFARKYANIFAGEQQWQSLPIGDEMLFPWNEASTYIKKPPYFKGFSMEAKAPGKIENARVLLLLGDSITTDHISPAGRITPQSPAGKYLKVHDVMPQEFNSYGSRRGNHEVMMRGTFANVRIKNQLIAPKEGGYTIKFSQRQETSVFNAAMTYHKEHIPLIVLAGKEYGTGSSRDWAAKGTQLLGVRAVIAESYERIHRSNLIGMGILPLQFPADKNPQTLGLDGSETYTIERLQKIHPAQKLNITACKEDGNCQHFEVISRLDTPVDVSYYLAGGILAFVLRGMAG